MGENFNILARGQKFLPFLSEEEKNWTEPFYFIQAADTQFGMQEKYNEGIVNYKWTKELQWSSQMIAEINAMRPQPKFLVVCGDLLDAWPETEQEVRDQQEIDFKNLFSELDIPLVCVCGNHDIGNQPTYKTVSKYRSSFGDDYFSFWCGGVFFIVMNTQYYEDASQVPIIAAEHDQWLEEQLEIVRLEKPQHAVVFQHIPYFLENPDEDKQYFNFDISERHEMLERLHEAGVRYVFCGHYHRNAGGFYKDLEQVVTSAVGAQLGGDDQGYRVVKVYEDRLEHRYYPLGTAPTCIHLEDQNNSCSRMHISKKKSSRMERTTSWSSHARSRSPRLARSSSLAL